MIWRIPARTPHLCLRNEEGLAALRDLEATYDGPIPEPARRAAQRGSAALLLMRARAESAFFAAMIRGQLATIRRRRADGSFYPALIEDLALYRRQYRAWRRLAAQLDAVPTPSPGAHEKWAATSAARV